MTNHVLALGCQPHWWSILTAPFMRNAVLGGTIAALAAGLIAYFIMLRHYAFATRALTHIGIPGATGAVLLSQPVTFGCWASSVSAAPWSSAISGSARPSGK